MAAEKIPTTMRAWQYATAKGGIDKNLKLNPSAPVPTPKKDQHLVKILATALNPVDYKPAEWPLTSLLLIPKPATPCIDIAGVIVTPAPGSPLKKGQLVFGAASKTPFAAGGLAEYAAVPSGSVISVPEGLSPIDAAACPVAALTAQQSLQPRLKQGSRVFLNGGSGGVGTYAIQIAKQSGAHVTVSCSGANAALCRSLGADEVLDYRASPLLGQLQRLAKDSKPFDLVVDHVFADPLLYWKAHTYTTPQAPFLNVAGTPSWGYIWTTIKINLLPGFLGGGKRRWESMLTESKEDQLREIGGKLASGEMKTVIDRVFAFEEGAEAFTRLKTGRARGKIVVEVAKAGS